MPFIRDDVQKLLAMLAATPGPQMHEVDPATARQMYQMMGQLAERPANPAVTQTDLAIPGPAGALKARRYAPPSPEPGRVLLFFHGGGWVIGDLETHNSLCSEIAALAGMTVVATDYRLAPETRFPGAVQDCLATVRWAASSPPELGSVTGIILAGDSAGGNLSAVCARALRREAPIVAQWLIYPGVDMTDATGSMTEFAEGYLLTAAGMAWFGDHYAADVDHEHASPLHSADWDALPPALVFTCGLDPLRDQGRAYAAKLISTGHRVIFREAPGQVHGSAQLRGALPSAQADLEGQIADLKALLA
ncbi:alpha/beta hydrolase [Sandaracinobacteroides saxicola]|uniref:Alpha/beta hydrolase n=1 Tax=Sandaracinobacteroides saxicola TaxID=2759707 RepID=A0A7G5IEC8_9SPHN|nr:alpha/beta hydrolase [Sandaracinobacteroides saxicola]QMW21720.1 alpha/beta hydrolase [Sandaracinobacteroides saxicola]